MEEEFEEYKRHIKNMHGDYPSIPPKLSANLQEAVERISSKKGQGKKKPSTQSVLEPSKILFSKLEFENAPSNAPRTRLPKDPAAALTKLERRRQKLSVLKTSSPQAAKEAEEREAWSKAIDRAQGVAVRDDPKLLKRTLTRKKKQKEKGKVQWEERQERIKEEKQKKQDKRRENIESRREAKKQHKSRK